MLLAASLFAAPAPAAPGPEEPAEAVRLAGWSSGCGGGSEPRPLGFVFLHAVGMSHHSWLATAERVAAEYPVL